MLALLKKDWLVATKTYKMMLLVLLLFALVGAITPRDFFYVLVPLVLCSALSASLIAFDENARWDVFSGSFPVPRRLLVTERYLFHLLLTAVLFLLCTLGIRRVYGLGSAEGRSMLFLMLFTALLLPSIVLPLMFKLGAAKGYLYSMGIMALGIGVAYLASEAMSYSVLLEVGPLAIIAAALLLLAVYALSWRLSVRLFEAREL